MTTQATLPGTLADVIENAATIAPLDRAWIAARIPHSGTMCLLDAVQSWDETHIRCIATSHRDPHNPLRSRGRLAAVCGVEYAAQAMAVHGALLGALDGAEAGRPRVGFLASVRTVVAHIERLDTLAAPLAIEAERVSGSGNTILYGFTVRGEGRVLLTGRAAVMLDASAVIR
ncbi:hotdog family protein [Paraburkholderia guartelaensis]|jgi:predicted hotdog family 3-hydroxylacyl-ACP dehydratase|uniref:hotdog family protein n=1 Tax=Paraburkholderia guartelaensis TaxID=2546446 RepID=UPI001FE9A781|nr:hotdog family protein [Paraburkholderia guartelaensis]